MQRGLDRVLEASDPEEARLEFEALASELESDADRALRTPEDGLEDAIAVLSLPQKYRRRLRTTNSLERLIEEVRRREKVIRIFPNETSAWRLLGPYLAELHEEWSTPGAATSGWMNTMPGRRSATGPRPSPGPPHKHQTPTGGPDLHDFSDLISR